MQPGGRLGITQPRRPDVRDAVTALVRQADAWRPGQVNAHAVRCTQARPFADQHDDDLRPQQFTDFVAHGDAALLDDCQRRQRPRFGSKLQMQRCQERRGILRDRV
jgi:hypothetical protein